MGNHRESFTRSYGAVEESQGITRTYVGQGFEGMQKNFRFDDVAKNKINKRRKSCP